jgi:hypothetical protein
LDKLPGAMGAWPAPSEGENLRLAPLVLAAAAFALAAPGLANATTYCVNSPGCSGTPEPDLQTALTTAEGTAGIADTVMVGSPGATPAAGYTYNATDRLDLVGAGPTATVLTASGAGSTVLSLTGGAGSTVSHLGLRLPAGGQYGAQTNASLSDVDVTSADPGTGTQTGVLFTGGSPTWTGGHVVLPPSSGNMVGVSADSPGVSLTLQDLFITAQARGLTLSRGSATLHRLSVASGTTMDVNGENVTVNNLLYRAIPAGELDFLVADSNLGDSVVNLAHVTAVGDGTAASTGILANGNGGHSLTVNLTDSIMRGMGTSVIRQANGAGSVSNVSVAYSDLDPFARQRETNAGGGSGSITSGAGNIGVDPKWANPAAGDFSLLAGSPAIDAGDPAAAPGAESATDLAGKPRFVGRTDMGALEFQPPSTPPADTTAPTMRLSRIPKKLRPKQLVTGFSFTVKPNEAATIDATLAGSARTVHLAKTYNVTLVHKRTARSTATRRITLKVRKKLLGSSKRFSVKLTLVATDSAGNKRTITRTIKVRK